MVSDRLLDIVQCPDCGSPLVRAADGLRCGGCSRGWPPSSAYLDLRPSTMFTEQTKYLDEALHADARHAHVSPPLLGAGVRHRMLQQFLRPSTGDLVVDLGCGSGQSLVWNAGTGATLVGIDVSPYFAAEAIDEGLLVLGDLRRLPFADGVFAKGYALDVFEHLSREGLEAMLAEIARVVRPGGQVFVYSHVRKNAPIALGIRAINGCSHALARLGLIDLAQEHLRKSDHLNPLADVPDLERTVAAAGFRIARIRYYTPLVGAFIQNIVMRMAERALGRWAGRGRTRAGDPSAQRNEEARLARAAAKSRLQQRGPLYLGVRALTALMMLDVYAFGRVESGPFFAVLEREAGPARP